MSSSEGRTVLKRNVKRTVSRESLEDGGRVVKRFHAPSALDRLLDRGRARREQRRLARLRDAGLRAPRPIEVRKRNGHWELVTEFVEGVTLRDVMHAGGPWPGGAPGAGSSVGRSGEGRVARRLGRELARAFARGIDHADLHPGNVLLDGAGRPWLIDAARCRVGAVPDAARMRAVLTALAAGTREHLAPLSRGLFLSAFLRALGPDRARELGARAVFAANLEDAARLHRRAALEERAARWMRESGAVTETRADGVRGFERRAATGSEPVREITIGADAIEAWRAAARLEMHRVPCARPLRLNLGTPPTATFEIDMQAGAAPDSRDVTRRTWRAIGAALGALHDRALTWHELGPEVLAIDGEQGRVRWLPRVRLQAFDASPASRRAQLQDLAHRYPARAGGHAAFLVGYLAAQRHSARETTSLRGELGRG